MKIHDKKNTTEISDKWWNSGILLQGSQDMAT